MGTVAPGLQDDLNVSSGLPAIIQNLDTLKRPAKCRVAGARKNLTLDFYIDRATSLRLPTRAFSGINGVFLSDINGVT